MNAEEITNSLIFHTSQNSNYETERNYISLSHCALPTEEIVSQYRNGFKDSILTRLRCYKGYQMEFDLLMRLGKVFPGKIKTGTEITAFNGIVRGHPDFMFTGEPGDCKSVLMDDWIPKDERLPRKVFWQMQGYMKYSNSKKSLVVYESREGGKIKAFWIYPNHRVQEEIHTKLNRVLGLLDLK